MKRMVSIAWTAVLAMTFVAGCKASSRSTGDAKVPQRQFFLTDFGGSGDGATINTNAFAKAIDACKAAGGGQIVVAPAGNGHSVYLTGPIELSSNMALVVEKGVTLKATDDVGAYGTPLAESDDFLNDEFRPMVKPIIGATGATNVAIMGDGVIDGCGQKWWDRVFTAKSAGAPGAGERRAATVKIPPRPRLVLLRDCKQVFIDGITLKDSPNFNIALFKCQKVLIQKVTITAPAHSPNTDGIDPGNCQDVVIRDCKISVGDDNVSFKCVRDGPALDNVLVTGCTFGDGHGASVGSALGSGIRNITVENCSFEGTKPAIRIKSARDRGALVENIIYRNITMKNVPTAIYLNMFYFDAAGQKERASKPITPTTPIIRNVKIENVKATGVGAAGEITGLPEMPIENVLMKNVTIDAQKGFVIRDARGVKLQNVKFDVKEGQPITIDHAEVEK